MNTTRGLKQKKLISTYTILCLSACNRKKLALEQVNHIPLSKKNIPSNQKIPKTIELA
jgi:uncharacterized lipoprotein YajG